MTRSTEREKHCSVTGLGRVDAVHDGNQWIIWGGTYDSEPDDDLDCLLLFSALSLSPWVRPFRSSSSLYCRSRAQTGGWGWHWARTMLGREVSGGRGGCSPAPFPVSWMPCSCCSRWCWCRPPRTGSSSPPPCRSRTRFAFSPGKRVPRPTGCSASWFQQSDKIIDWVSMRLIQSSVCKCWQSVAIIMLLQCIHNS